MSGDNTKAGRTAATANATQGEMKRSARHSDTENPQLPDLLNSIKKAMSSPEPKPERKLNRERDGSTPHYGAKAPLNTGTRHQATLRATKTSTRGATQRQPDQSTNRDTGSPTGTTDAKSAVPSNNDEILASLVRLADSTAKGPVAGDKKSRRTSTPPKTQHQPQQETRRSQQRHTRKVSNTQHAASEDQPKVAPADQSTTTRDTFSAEQLARHFEVAKSPSHSSPRLPKSPTEHNIPRSASRRKSTPAKRDGLDQANLDWIAEKLSHISTLVEERNGERSSFSDQTAAVEARLINLESQIQSALGQIASQTADATIREIESWIAEISHRVGKAGALSRNADPVENQLRLLASRLSEIDRDTHDFASTNFRPALTNDTVEDGGQLVVDQLPPPAALPPPAQTEASASKLDTIVKLLETAIDENRSERQWTSEKLEDMHKTMLGALTPGSGGMRHASSNQRTNNTPNQRKSGPLRESVSGGGLHRSSENSMPEDAGHAGSTEESMIDPKSSFGASPFGTTDTHVAQGIEHRLSRVRLALASLAVVAVGVSLGAAVYTWRKTDPPRSYLGALESDGSMMTQITTGAVNTRSVTTTNVPTGIVIQQPTQTDGSLVTMANKPAVSQTVLDAATKGNASAEFAVGLRYAQAPGGTENFAHAAGWYRRSANNGFALAQYQLATLYERGLGVSKDIAKAKMWYERSARQGNIKSMHNLAVLTASDPNDPSAYSLAARWFSEAASYGLADSQFNLAMLYESGLGVEKDTALARKWFELAARTGDAEARRRSDALTSKIEKSEIERSDTMIANWRARPFDRLANDPATTLLQWQNLRTVGNTD